MALVSFAVVGRENEPLYLRDFDKDEASPAEGEGAGFAEASPEDDPFGFFTKSDARANESCSLHHQFIIHAALDRFEEITGPMAGNRWRTPGATGSNAMWVGLLCPIEEVRVYGYLTNTSIKFMAVIKDGDDRRQSIREADLKSLFANAHQLYVEYLLNPFSQLRGKIVSTKFDDGLKQHVQSFNEKCGEAISWM